MAKVTKVIDGVPYRLRGWKDKTKSVVEFIHRCCRCGLEHDVKIEHEGKKPDVDITFNRKENT